MVVATNCGGSHYKYIVFLYFVEVLRGETVVSNNNKYTPQPGDRAGFLLRCIDVVHINWTNKQDIIATQLFHPFCKFHSEIKLQGFHVPLLSSITCLQQQVLVRKL